MGPNSFIRYRLPVMTDGYKKSIGNALEPFGQKRQANCLFHIRVIRQDSKGLSDMPPACERCTFQLVLKALECFSEIVNACEDRQTIQMCIG